VEPTPTHLWQKTANLLAIGILAKKIMQLSIKKVNKQCINNATNHML